MRRAVGPASLALLLTGSALLLLLPTASAHAVLQTATPPPNGHAEANLTLIEIVFTEDVERHYTKADLIDLQGESWANGPTQFDGERRNVIRLPLQPLPSGIYAVSWQTLSVDTHTARGTYIFSVGDAQLRFPLDTSAHDHAEHSLDKVLREGLARTVFYGGLFLVVGIPVFALAVLRGPAPAPMLHTAAAAGITGAAGGIASLALLAQRIDLPMLDAVRTSAGTFLATRAGLLLLGALLLTVAARRPHDRRLVLGAVIAGALSVLATALGSHAAASRQATGFLIAADALHVAMGAVWVGGLVGFLHVFRGRSAEDIARLIVRFSPWAMGSVAILLLTGAAASIAHIPCLRGEACAEALLSQPYARLVLAKLLLLVPLGALGWYNQTRLGPRLRRGDGTPAAFRRTIQAEAILMVLVLGAAGVLASTPPPDAVVEGAQVRRDVLELEQQTEKSHVILQVRPDPVTVGIQEVRVVVHPLGPTLPNGTTVQLKVWGPGDIEPETNIDLERVAPDEWALQDALFTRAGEWNVSVLLDRGDEFAKLKFKIPVVNPT